jgi:hypothetical protein
MVELGWSWLEHVNFKSVGKKLFKGYKLSTLTGISQSMTIHTDLNHHFLQNKFKTVLS